MEGKLDRLVHGTDEWADQTNPGQLIPWNDRSALTNRQTALEAWRDQAQPRIDVNIEPWVMRYMDIAAAPFSMDLLKNDLMDLASQGSSKQRLLAEEGLAYMGRAKYGHRKGT